MAEAPAHQSGWKAKAVHEIREYYINFVYLAFFLVAFTWYRRLILAAYDVHYTEYWVPLVEAAVLAKVIMIGDLLRVGGTHNDRPLIVVSLYRTVVFSVLLVGVSVLEKTIRGLLHGDGVFGGLDAIAQRDWHELVAQCVMTFAAFIPFFALKELERVIGTERFRRLFWTRGERTLN